MHAHAALLDSCWRVVHPCGLFVSFFWANKDPLLLRWLLRLLDWGFTGKIKEVEEKSSEFLNKWQDRSHELLQSFLRLFSWSGNGIIGPSPPQSLLCPFPAIPQCLWPNLLYLIHFSVRTRPGFATGGACTRPFGYRGRHCSVG